MDNNPNLCRICLHKNAAIPIFKSEIDCKDVLTKITFCLHEEIYDIEGYPKNICEGCFNDLENACEFINRIKKTDEIIKNYLLPLKEEQFEFKEEPVEDDFSGPENDIPEDENNESIEFNINCLKRKVKKEKKYSNLKKENKCQKTNHIASSILEGVYSWTGESWCPSSKIKISCNNIKNVVKKRPLKKRKVVKQKNTEKLCDHCGKVFHRADALNMHVKRKHFPEKHQCSECSKAYTTKYHLARHVRMKHIGIEKNFVCSVCGKSFFLKSSLNAHVSKHSKDYIKKSFNCSFCPKSYACKKSVVIHERSVHTGMRPAVCSICDSSFYHEDYLKEHMRLHTGDTPFKCPVCNRGYAQRGNMKSHLRIHKISEIDSEILAKLKPNYIKLMKS